ncbi:transcription initiation factor TFIID subunit 4-like isoform X2 [Mugil cephalus]|uniref:transcription initiation factor TFIID subunit 4-like isoform X2 n=1 Tax=Mugil cephalus TaxID=48193 RepID=UPI001FB5CFC0|nr:transcription initiation factor TFIID subunit 4-like isoform X2 [Mugil cephalus]
MRLTIERSWVKMAAGSDLLDDVFNTEVDEKVVSDLVGSLESELTGTEHANATPRVQSAANHVGSSAIGSNSNVQGSKMGLSQQELAKAGTGVQGGVSNSTGSHGPSMDGAAGITSAAGGPSMTAAQSQSKPGTASGVVTVVTDATSGAGKTAVQTLNGSSVVMNCHVPGGGSADNNNSHPAVTVVNNGPASVTKAVLSAAPSAIIRTTLSAQNAATPSVISSQPSFKTVPTVTLVRPPMQTPTVTSQSAGSPAAVFTSPAASVTSTTGSVVNKIDSTKTIMQTGAHVVTSSVLTGTTATIRSPTVLQGLRTSVPSTIAATAPGGIRAIAPQMLAPRLPQPQQNAPNIQNIQIPAGMVLVRSESGQLLMIHQQALAQMQAQSQSQSAMTPRPAAPASTPPVQITTLQAPGASVLARPVTPTTIIKQSSTGQTTVTTTTTLQRPPVLQNTIMLGGTATTTGQPLGTATTVQPGSAATAVAQRVGTGTPVPPTPVSAETLENVKKCRNFLSTLIKLASGGKQSSETTANVKELVKNLLEAKIEPEDFTSRLYQELNSSPQPYLVPFLKRSLPALRQMTPDSEAFIQQSLLPQSSAQTAAAAAPTALTAVVLRPPLSSPITTATNTAATKTTVISLPQTPHSKPGLIVSQPGTMVRPQVTLAQSSVVTLRGQPHSRIIVSQPPVVKQLQTVKQTLTPVVKGVQVISQASLTVAQKNKLKEAGGGTFRDDDDINDVASMAGVNLSEESARILATGSELVGMVTRSCKDETFLSTSSLTRTALEIGKKFGVSELGADVINYISHATQQRLQNLLEKVSQVAQQKNGTFKEDERYEQSGDVRAQLKFFEQLDQMEKQRKEEQEREILLKAAKSRSRQEDPEQLRLKQKAKEMQQQELAQIRQREANLTALAAIGPRKKRKMDSPVRGASAEGSGSGPSQPGGSSGSGSRQFTRQRITRVNLRDLLFCLENERGTSHSQLLYKGFLK